jgi:hypothetical protein
MKKTANIATMPSRVNELKKTLESIRGQFDEVRIYLNEFDKVPTFLNEYTTATGDNLTDNGKFYFLQEAGDEYYFSMDDDIIYPSTYAKDMVAEIEKHKTIVTHHGRLLGEKDVSYYRGHTFHHCANEQPERRRIDVPGTGVTAFDTRYFKPITIFASPDKCMSDIVFGLEAMKKGKRVTVLPHACGYIRPIPVTESIYNKHRKNELRQIQLANEIVEMKKYFSF